MVFSWSLCGWGQICQYWNIIKKPSQQKQHHYIDKETSRMKHHQINIITKTSPLKHSDRNVTIIIKTSQQKHQNQPWTLHEDTIILPYNLYWKFDIMTFQWCNCMWCNVSVTFFCSIFLQVACVNVLALFID